MLSTTDNNNDTSSTLVPSFAATSISDPSLHYLSDIIDPIAAAGNSSCFHRQTNHHHHPLKHSPSSTSTIHNNKKIFHNTTSLQPNLQKDKHLLCKLCNNLHSSPWHTTVAETLGRPQDPVLFRIGIYTTLYIKEE